MERPIPLKEPNIELLKNAIDKYLNHLEDENTCEDTQSDLDYLLKEAAIECVYGKNADDFIENCLNEIENRE